jgi:hypothetical protein
MNRRVFVKLGILGAGALTIPLIHCRSNDAYSISLMQPAFLSQICEEKVIQEIGIALRKLKPEFQKKETVVRTLMTTLDDKKINVKTSSEELEKIMEQKIQSDFKNGKTIILKGWVLSETEAYQCALFSFSYNKQ